VPENYKQGTEAFSTSDAVISQGVFSCYDYALKTLGCVNNNKKILKDPLDVTNHGEDFPNQNPPLNQTSTTAIDNSGITCPHATKKCSWQNLIDNTIESKNIIKPKTDPLDIKNYSPRSLIKVVKVK
jgi:hypothetical protein